FGFRHSDVFRTCRECLQDWSKPDLRLPQDARATQSKGCASPHSPPALKGGALRRRWNPARARRARIYFSVARRLPARRAIQLGESGRSTFAISLFGLLQRRPEILGGVIPKLFFERCHGRKFTGVNAGQHIFE